MKTEKLVELLKQAYACGWGDAVVNLDSEDSDIMVKSFKEFIDRTLTSERLRVAMEALINPSYFPR